jgi:hypothetical protein
MHAEPYVFGYLANLIFANLLTIQDKRRWLLELLETWPVIV